MQVQQQYFCYCCQSVVPLVDTPTHANGMCGLRARWAQMIQEKNALNNSSAWLTNPMLGNCGLNYQSFQPLQHHPMLNMNLIPNYQTCQPLQTSYGMLNLNHGQNYQTFQPLKNPHEMLNVNHGQNYQTFQPLKTPHPILRVNHDQTIKAPIEMGQALQSSLKFNEPMRPTILAPTKASNDLDSSAFVTMDKGVDKSKNTSIQNKSNLEEKTKDKLYCDHCKITLTTEISYQNHINSMTHLKKRKLLASIALERQRLKNLECQNRNLLATRKELKAFVIGCRDTHYLPDHDQKEMEKILSNDVDDLICID